VERAREVDVEDLLPILVLHLEHRPVRRDARVVDQDVQATVLLDDLGDRPAAVVGRADVALVIEPVVPVSSISWRNCSAASLLEP
jgi:hypothetical protein